MDLSGSTNGQGILVTGADSAGAVLIDERVLGKMPTWDENGQSIKDENGDTILNDVDHGDYTQYIIRAANTHDSDVMLSIEFGGSSPNQLITKKLTANGGIEMVFSGDSLKIPCTVKAFASVANKVNVYGSAQQIMNT